MIVVVVVVVVVVITSVERLRRLVVAGGTHVKSCILIGLSTTFEATNIPELDANPGPAMFASRSGMFEACKCFGDKCLTFGGREEDDVFQTWGANVGQHLTFEGRKVEPHALQWASRD
jgi:hypothetical protein